MPTTTRTPTTKAVTALHPEIAALVAYAAEIAYHEEERNEILYALALPSGETLLVWEGNHRSGFRGNAEVYLIPPYAELVDLTTRAREHGIIAALCEPATSLYHYHTSWTGTIGVG